MEIQKFPPLYHDPSKRLETGPVQFGDDWPGIFFRGDNAGWSAMILGQFIETARTGRGEFDPFMLIQLECLQKTLAGCVIGPVGENLK